MSQLPSISVITVSFNQADYLQEAIESVLGQNYPELEYIVIDGGSTDRSVDIIEDYAEQLHYWVSEPDRGQSHALNKGFEKATGDIVCWINSDDYLLPNSLLNVAEHFRDNPTSNWLIGSCLLVDAQGQGEQVVAAQWQGRDSLLRFWQGWEGGSLIWQQSSFWRRSLTASNKLLNESLHFGLDYELWIRLAEQCKPDVSEEIFAAYRFHTDSKTVSEPARFWREQATVARPYWRQQFSPKQQLFCEQQWRQRCATQLGKARQWRKAVAIYPLLLLKPPVWRRLLGQLRSELTRSENR